MTRNTANPPSGRDLCLRAHLFPYQPSQRTVLDQDLQNIGPDIAAQETRSRIKTQQHYLSQIKTDNAKDAIAMLRRQIPLLRLSRGDHEMLVQTRSETPAGSDENIVHPKEVERETRQLLAEVADINRKVGVKRGAASLERDAQ